MAVVGLVGVLLGSAAKSANASGGGPTSTVTVTPPAATVTTHSTSTVTKQVTHTAVARVTSTKTVTEAAAQPMASTASSAAQDCTPGYTPCIPPGPDVDCAGGSGNGPRYVDGPVYVTGSDPYGLDADHNGVGCE